MKTKNTLLLLLLLFSPFVLMAYKIQGKITDDQKHPLSDVVVRIVKEDSTLYATYITDSSGNFEINYPSDTQFTLATTNIAYENYSKKIASSNKDILIGSILLHKNNIQIDEVTVEGERVEDKGVKTVAFPTEKQQKHALSGVDLIKSMQLPGIISNSDGISILGTSGIQYRINGMNASSVQVDVLDPADIDHIEYSRTPTMRELNEDFGVINIITKKPQKGTYVLANINGSIPCVPTLTNINLKKVFSSNSQFSLNYYVRYMITDDVTGYSIQEYYKPNSKIVWDQKLLNAPFKLWNHSLYAEYIYKKSRNSLSIKFQGDFDTNDNSSYYTTQDENETFLYDRTVDSYIKGETPSIDFYFIHKIDEYNRFEMHFVPSIDIRGNETSLADKYTSYTDSVTTDNQSITPSISYEALYSLEKKKFNLSTGLQTTYKLSRSYIENNNSLDTAKVHWVDVYPYVNIGGQLLPKLNASVGTGIKYSYSNDGVTTMHFVRNLSMLNILYKFNTKWSLNNTLSFTPNYPSLTSLNDVETKTDSLNISRGNPFLKPSEKIRDKAYITYTPMKKLTLTLQEDVYKEFRPIYTSYFYDPKADYFVAQPENQKSDFYSSLSLIINCVKMFHEILDIEFQGTWDYYETHGKNYDIYQHNFSWYVYTSIYYKKLRASFFMNGIDRRLYGPERIRTQYPTSNIQVSYKLKDLTFGLGIWAINRPQIDKIDRVSDVMPSEQLQSRNDIANNINLNIIYRLSRGLEQIELDKKL